MFDADTPEDRQAREMLEAERKAALFDHALAEAREVPKQADKLKRLEASLETLSKASERPVQVTLAPPAKAKADKSYQQRLSPTRQLALAAAAAMLSHKMQQPTDSLLRKLLPGDRFKDMRQRIDSIHYKAAVAPASTTQVGWAAEIVRSTTNAFWDDLKEQSVLAQLRKLGTNLDFDGANSLTIPSRGPKSITSAWIEEGASIPVDSANFASQTLTRSKKGVIVACSNELLRTSNPAILPLLEGYIKDDLATALDGDLMDDTAAIPGVRPASILNGAPTQAATGTDLAAIVADIRWLRSQLTNVVRKPLLIMHDDRKLGLESLLDTNDRFPFRKELQELGAVLGYPVLSSPYVPATTVAMVDASAFTMGADPILIDTSSAVTLVMTSAAVPAPWMGDAATSPSVTGPDSVHVSDAAGTIPPSEVRSMLQTDSVALRMVAPVSWGMRSTGKVSYLSGVSW